MRPSTQGVPKIVFVITDGASSNKAQTLTAANEIKKRGFDIISIGVGNINKEELMLMSSTGDDFYLFENLNKLFSIDFKNFGFDVLKKSKQQPAEIKPNINVVNEVSKNSYKYFQYPMDTQKNLLFN